MKLHQAANLPQPATYRRSHNWCPWNWPRGKRGSHRRSPIRRPIAGDPMRPAEAQDLGRKSPTFQPSVAPQSHIQSPMPLPISGNLNSAPRARLSFASSHKQRPGDGGVTDTSSREASRRQHSEPEQTSHNRRPCGCSHRRPPVVPYPHTRQPMDGAGSPISTYLSSHELPPVVP